MTRFLQSLLTLALIVAVFQIVSSAYVFFMMNRLRNYDPGPELRSKVHTGISWDHWPFVIGREWRYDSSTDKGAMQPYLGLSGVRLPQFIFHQDVEYFQDGDRQRALRWNEERYPIAFISEAEFGNSRMLVIFLFIIELALTFIIWRQLYLFARLAGKKEFFDARNGKRLRIIGWFITAMGLFTFVSPYLSVWLFDLKTGLGPYLTVHMRENWGSLYWVIAGLLLLVIAEAFRKGNQLQTEQEFTI